MAELELQSLLNRNEIIHSILYCNVRKANRACRKQALKATVQHGLGKVKLTFPVFP